MKAAADFLTACELCPRRCGVDRSGGKTGYCRAGAQPEVYRYGPHYGEEPPISGERGSGTVFFSRCTMRCLYCQNHTWSQEGAGEIVTVDALTRILRRLAADGCHNWNLVSPTPWLPLIREAIDGARKSGVSLPVVYNTSGFERTETVTEFRDVADVFLVDLRYSRRRTAEEASGTGSYVDVARAAVKHMWRQAGPLAIGSDGTAASGVICRLLILPGRADEAVENLEWLAAEIGTEIPVSVMAQYLPAHRARATPTWDRRITAEEHARVRETVERLGFREGWIQDLAEDPPDELVGFRMKAGGSALGR